jgi:hypothetical protein
MPNHHQLPPEIFEQILTGVVSEVIHGTFLLCVAFPSIPDAEIQKRIQEEQRLCEAMRFRSILALCRIDHSYRSAMHQLLLRICPPNFHFQEARIQRDLPLPALCKAQLECRKTLPTNSHPILNSLCSVYNIGVCCLAIGTTGRDNLSQAEELYESLRALDPIQSSPLARVYLLLSRMRITVCNTSSNPSASSILDLIRGTNDENFPSFNDNFIEIAHLDTVFSPWYTSFLYEAIHQVALTHYGLRAGKRRTPIE